MQLTNKIAVDTATEQTIASHKLENGVIVRLCVAECTKSPYKMDEAYYIISNGDATLIDEDNYDECNADLGGQLTQHLPRWF